MLGFTLDATWGPDPDGPPTWCSLDYGPAALMFTHGAERRIRPARGHRVAVLLSGERRPLLRALVERGVSTLTAPVDREYGMRDFALEDPNGYLLHFGQPLDEIPEHE